MLKAVKSYLYHHSQGNHQNVKSPYMPTFIYSQCVVKQKLTIISNFKKIFFGYNQNKIIEYSRSFITFHQFAYCTSIQYPNTLPLVYKTYKDKTKFLFSNFNL